MERVTKLLRESNQIKFNAGGFENGLCAGESSKKSPKIETPGLNILHWLDVCLPGATLVRRPFCPKKTVFCPTATDKIVGQMTVGQMVVYTPMVLVEMVMVMMRGLVEMMVGGGDGGDGGDGDKKCSSPH